MKPSGAALTNSRRATGGYAGMLGEDGHAGERRTCWEKTGMLGERRACWGKDGHAVGRTGMLGEDGMLQKMGILGEDRNAGLIGMES